MDFNINGNIWNIELVTEAELLELYRKREDDEARYCFGVTLYPEHKILVNKEMCYDQILKTLRHELTHCWIWNSGLFNVPNYTEEMVCDLVSCVGPRIENVIKEFEYINKSKLNIKIGEVNG